MGGMASTIISSVLVSATLAPVHLTARGTPRRQTTTWRFVPGLPLSVGFGPTAWPPFLPGLKPSPKMLLTSQSLLLLVTRRARSCATSPTHLLEIGRAHV